MSLDGSVDSLLPLEAESMRGLPRFFRLLEMQSLFQRFLQNSDFDFDFFFQNILFGFTDCFSYSSCSCLLENV